MTQFLPIPNGGRIPRAEIPHLPFDTFRSEALNIVKNGGKVVQFFAYEDQGNLKILSVLRTDKLLAAGCDAPDTWLSLTCECEPFHLFEREMAEQFGIRPEGHPWLKMVRYHKIIGEPQICSATTILRIFPVTMTTIRWQETTSMKWLWGRCMPA